MATNLPPINIPLTVSGIDDVKKQLLSINRTVDQLERIRQNKSLKNAKASAAKLEDVLSKSSEVQLNEIGKLNKATISAQRKLHKKIEEAEKKHLSKMSSFNKKQTKEASKGFGRTPGGGGSSSGGGGFFSSIGRAFSGSSAAGGAASLGAAGAAGGVAGVAASMIKENMDKVVDAIKSVFMAIKNYVLPILEKSIALEKQATKVSVNSGGAVSTEAITKKAKEISAKFGIAQEDVINTIDALAAKTGDAVKAMANVDSIIEFSVASAANPIDIAKTAGQLMASDKTLTPEQVSQYSRFVIGEGREGQLESDENNAYIPDYLSGSSKYAGDRFDNFKQLLSLASIAAEKGGANGAAGASNTMNNFIKAQSTKSKQFGELGIKTINKDGTLISAEQVIRDTLDKTRGNLGKLTGAGGALSDMEAQKAITGPMQIYNDAKKAALEAKKTESEAHKAGLDAFDAEMQRFKNAAISNEQIAKDAAENANTVDASLARISAALEALVMDEFADSVLYFESIVYQLAPVAMDLLQVIAKITNALMKAGNYWSIGVQKVFGKTKEATANNIPAGAAEAIGISGESENGAEYRDPVATRTREEIIAEKERRKKEFQERIAREQQERAAKSEAEAAANKPAAEEPSLKPDVQQAQIAHNKKVGDEFGRAAAKAIRDELRRNGPPATTPVRN